MRQGIAVGGVDHPQTRWGRQAITSWERFWFFSEREQDNVSQFSFPYIVLSILLKLQPPIISLILLIINSLL